MGMIVKNVHITNTNVVDKWKNSRTIENIVSLYLS